MSSYLGFKGHPLPLRKGYLVLGLFPSFPPRQEMFNFKGGLKPRRTPKITAERSIYCTCAVGLSLMANGCPRGVIRGLQITEHGLRDN